MPDSFPQRHGLAGPPPGTLLRDEVPISFRTFLIDLPHAGVGVEIDEVHRATCDVLQVYANDNLQPYYDYRHHIRTCEWFCIYAIIERLYALLYGKDYYSPFPTRFVEAINKAFFDQNIGWHLSPHGKVVMRGDEAFENTAKTCLEVLGKDNKPTAAGHIQSALSALSTRPKSNTSGAVVHSTNVLECVLGEITGETLTLGDYLKRNPNLFHPALKKGLEGIWGYASEEGARHGKEGVEPAQEEAEFVVAVCAAASTFLTRKNHKCQTSPS